MAVRTFIALPIPESQKIIDFHHELIAADSGKGRPVAPHNMHLTLRFMGDLEEDRLPTLYDAVREAASKAAAFPVTICGTGAFPKRQYMKVIWLGVEDEAAAHMRVLAAELNKQLSRRGFGTDRFKAHLTVARVRFLKDKKAINELMDSHGEEVFAEFKTDSIQVIKSELTSEGPVYTVIEEIELGCEPPEPVNVGVAQPPEDMGQKKPKKRAKRKPKNGKEVKSGGKIGAKDSAKTAAAKKKARKPKIKKGSKGTIIFVTSNDGKMSEFQEELEPLGYLVEQRDLGYPEIQADTLEEVVESGLRELLDRAEHPVVIDDSGIFVHALNGFPGVYSAYAYKTLHYSGILKLLEEAKDRSAHFETVIGFGEKGEEGEHVIQTFKGEVHGKIAEYPQDGGFGFGYDPVFMPNGQDLTFAEMSSEEKNRISHRGRALERLVQFLQAKK